MEAEIVGERVNCGGNYGLEIHVLYHFLGPAKAIEKIETVEKELECNVSKCLK